MATQEDDNKVVSNTNINIGQEKNFITVYKKFEWILNNKNETFTKKTESLVEVWHNLAQCKFENSDLQYIVQIIDWAKLHTLNIVLTGEWKKFKDQYEEPLLKEVKSTQALLTKINNAFYTRCQKLLDVINNPWSDPTLEYLVTTSNAEIGPKEIEFFCVETAYLTSVRLKKLCESQCEDLALNLVKAFMKCYQLSQTDNFNLNATETQVWFIFDMYVALLYKFKEKNSLLEMLKGLSAEEGLNLIKRFAKKRVKISKVWKHCHRIAILASQVYISSTILKPIEYVQDILKQLIQAYISLNTTEEFLQDVVSSIRSIIRLAETAAHIYIFCVVFQEKFNIRMKSFIIELYIRALTTDMNLLERQKSDNEKDKIIETTKRLSGGFTSLAEVLKDDVKVSRECILTAFSLDPTDERMKKIEELAKLSGFKVLDTGQKWKCKLHPPVLPSDDLAWICNSCGDFMCKPQLNVPLNTNIALNEALTEEKLGITRELCDDLVVLLSSPRYQVFSWLLDWPDLQRLCVMYLNDPETTKNLVTELKFLDIDYSMFASIKKEPLDEYAGIEKGYEHYLDHEFHSEDEDRISNVSEDIGSLESRFYNLSSDNSASEMLVQPINPRTSDPNTLKSLRMFRPSLKRSRNNSEASVPEKVSKGNMVNVAIPNCSKQFDMNYTPNLYSQQAYSNNVVFSNNLESMLQMSHSVVQPQMLKKNVTSFGNFNSSIYCKPLESMQKPSFRTNTSTSYLESTNSSKEKEYSQLPGMNNGTTCNLDKQHTFSSSTQPQKILYNEYNHNNVFDSTYYKTYPEKSSSMNEFHLATQNIINNTVISSVHDSNSKNGQVATLQEVGGQVAVVNNPNKPIDTNLVHGNSPNNINLEIHSNKVEISSIKFTQELPQNLTNPLQTHKKTVIVEKPIHPANTTAIKTNINNTECPNTSSHSKESQESQQSVTNVTLSNHLKYDNEEKENILFTSQSNEPIFLENKQQAVVSEVPNLFEDLQPAKIQVKTPFQCNNSEVVEVEETKRDTTQLKRYFKKTKSFSKENGCMNSVNEIKVAVKNLLIDGDDEKSIISIEDGDSGYADTLINSDSEYDNFSTNNPLHHNVMNKIDSFEQKRRILKKSYRKSFFSEQGSLENQTESSDYSNKIKAFVPKDTYYLKKDIDNNCKPYLHKEPKYESCPDTGSDSQLEQDSDDQYNKCYIELFRNNLLYDTTKGVCKNIDSYLKKSINNNSVIVSPLKKGKKLKKGCSSKKNRKSKTGNALNKTVLDIDSSSKPKSDIQIRDVRVVLQRLPAASLNTYLESDSIRDMQKEISKNQTLQIGKEFSHDTKFKGCQEYNSNQNSISFSEDLEVEQALENNEKYSFLQSEQSKKDISSCNNNNDMNDFYNNFKNDRKFNLKDYTRIPNDKNNAELNKNSFIEGDKVLDDNDVKNPTVLLNRLSVTNKTYVRTVLANVPGLHDTELMRPSNTDLVVNVVQIAGGRNNTSVPVANAQTSTQVTPHIQRIGQPRVEKSQTDQTDDSDTSVTTVGNTTGSTVKPTTSQPSTLINILSQQVIRPGQSNCIRTRPSPLINIVSHQIIRPSTQVVPKMTTSSAQTNDQILQKTETFDMPTSSSASLVKNVTATVKSTTGTAAAPAPGTILQFICKSATLPKFQQAFGKTVYQTTNIETAEATNSGENSSISLDVNKKIPVKNPTVNIQPIQGSVIYTRQVPVGQAINLIPPGRQVFRIATSNPEQISLVKDTVIHSKMSALLTAALQGKKATEVQVEGETNSENVERVTLTRPTLVQNARIVKPVIQIPSNVIRTNTTTQSNLSSTTLEQLREFDMVYKQIKERSNTGANPSECSTQSEPESSPQGISVTYLNQGQKLTQLSPVVVVSSYCNLQPAASPALSVTSQGSSSPCVTPAPTPTLPKVSSKTSSKGKSLKNASTHTSKASPIPKPQQKPQEDEHTTQRIFDILAEYAEQLRNSPDLNNKPAPRRRSNPPTNPNHNSKRKKSSSSKKSSATGSGTSEPDLEDQRTMGSEDSSCGVMQLSSKDDELPQSQTTESNDSTSSTRPLILTETNTTPTTRNLIIADSSVGEALKLQNTAVLVPGNYIMPVSMVKGGQQIAVVSGGSKILATVPARTGPNMLLFQSFLNQNRKPGVPTVKYSTLQPISGLTSQNLAGVSGQSPVILPQNTHNLTAVTLGQPLTLKKVKDSDNRLNTELLLAIAQPRDNTSAPESSPQPDSSTSVQNSTSIKLEENSTIHTSSSSDKIFNYQKSIITTPVATPVISQSSLVKNEPEVTSLSSHPSIITLNISPENNKDDASKAIKRVQSVLVTACTSNGPMLSHTPPRYRKSSDSIDLNNDVNIKSGYLHNGEKLKEDSKHFQNTAVYFPNKSKKATSPARVDRELHQLCLQRKQAAIERELRLQKSLSEECEDLGVDEPSTSDLFPEADLLFDSNHSPPFDQVSQNMEKKPSHQDKSITLFCDDENSSSLRTDFLFDSVQYQTEGELQYDQSRQLANGQGSTSNESGSSCEDNTLLQNCASMSDVTLNSPISPEFTDNPAHMNKYKFKYSNRKKTERHKPVETWALSGEVSSSEDTMCGELDKITHSPKTCVIKRESQNSSCDEDEEFKVVRVAISKTDLAKDEESCEESHFEDDLDSPSGRGARRSVKKLCSCCNGAQEGNRKRPSSRPHTPALHKKAFLNKKR